MRKLVMKTCPNIEFINGTVTGLKVSPDKQTVTGVTYRPKASEGASGQELTLNAVFVSDCTGPSCAGVKWLKAHEYIC
jgi:alkyl hydroperoxide reductase subunit AhpF